MAANREFLPWLLAAQATAQSSLGVGIDPNPNAFPGTWKGDRKKIRDFSHAVVKATCFAAACYKPQIAYYAAYRAERALESTINYIHGTTDLPVILDAKRGDIGATSEHYAAEAFDRYRADAVTVSPFMGFDSFHPFLRPGKGVFLLCRTSNPGGSDLQNNWVLVQDPEEQAYFESLGIHVRYPGGGREMLVQQYCRVAYLAMKRWNTNGQLGLVVGATFPQELKTVRLIAPHLPLLIPGVGKQGATADDAMQVSGPNAPVVVISARAIIDPQLNAGEKWSAGCSRMARTTSDSLRAARPTTTTA